MRYTPNIIVIGAGVVGLSIGSSFLKSRPESNVVIIEKETSLGCHASGRNSGVIHSGFYYAPDSLRARFCREGHEALTELIKRNDLSLVKTGKIVVTQNPEQIQSLTELYKRGIENGVRVELIDSSEISKFEPLAVTSQAFLWSPNTSIASPSEVIHAMAREFRALGGKINFGQQVEFIEGKSLRISGATVFADLIINCAGTQALRIAQSTGVGMGFAQLPFKGLYKYTEAHSLPLKTLVYPLPDPNFPFLGIHFTLTVDGKVKIGPSAMPVIGSEQYTFHDAFSFSDFKQTAASIKSLLIHNFKQSLDLGKREFPNLRTSNMLMESKKLVPASANVKNWKQYRSGIRAQLVNLSSGTLIQDFQVEKVASCIHVLNSISPGWTTSIPFGKWIANQGFDMLN